MPALLISLLGYVLSSFLLKVFAGLGIAVFSYWGLSNLVESALNYMVPLLGALPSGVIAIISMSGVPEGLSVIASAALTRAAFESARAFVGVAG